MAAGGRDVNVHGPALVRRGRVCSRLSRPAASGGQGAARLVRGGGTAHPGSPRWSPRRRARPAARTARASAPLAAPAGGGSSTGRTLRLLGDELAVRQVADYIMAVVANPFRPVIDVGDLLQEAHVRCGPWDYSTEAERVFGCTVKCSQPENRPVFAPRLIEAASGFASSVVADAMVKFAESLRREAPIPATFRGRVEVVTRRMLARNPCRARHRGTRAVRERSDPPRAARGGADNVQIGSGRSGMGSRHHVAGESKSRRRNGRIARWKSLRHSSGQASGWCNRRNVGERVATSFTCRSAASGGAICPCRSRLAARTGRSTG